jgi:long-chain acyl-CoA synthetase
LLFTNYPVYQPNVPICGEDTAMILFTSGTTGNPKGCVITHGSLYTYVTEVGDRNEHLPNVRFLASHPLYHMSSIIHILKSIHDGMTMVFLSDPTPTDIWETIEKERITMMLAFPSVYTYMLEELKERMEQGSDISSFKVALTGGTKVPVSLIQRYKEYGIYMVQGYGSTESWTVSAWKPQMGFKKAESVGQPLKNVAVKVIDPDTGEALPAGQIGEIIVQSPYVFQGYWNNPEATQKVYKNGWFHMGDAGMFDKDGFLYIMGRYKDVIVYGGDNIYPDQVEEVIQQMDGVLEVAVIGVPDEIFGEVPRAYVVKERDCSLTEEDIVKYCKERIASYKVPEVVFADHLPKNTLGKVLKRQLKRDAIAVS